MVEYSFIDSVVGGSNPFAVTSTSDITPVSRKEFLDIQATIECRFHRLGVRNMIITYSQKCKSFTKIMRKSKLPIQTTLKRKGD